MKNISKAALALSIFATVAAPAYATTVYVLPNTTWATPAGDNSGGGSSAITDTVAHDGNGSLELFGDRTRFALGQPFNPASNLGLLSSVTEFTFDWSIATNSISNLSPDLTPALRLVVYDLGVKSELIWEGAYNGTYGNTQAGLWYTSGVNDKFYKNGTSENAGTQIYNAMSQYGYTSDAYIAAITVGVGSSAGSGYHAFADNVSITTKTSPTTTKTTTYNFATQVPDNGSTAALLGLGFVGMVWFRSRQRAANA